MPFSLLQRLRVLKSKSSKKKSLVQKSANDYKRQTVKFIYSEKATKFREIFTLLLSYGVLVTFDFSIYSQKYNEDLANFVAFSEYMNFTVCSNFITVYP